MRSATRLERFISTKLRLSPAASVPEIVLYQAAAQSRLRRSAVAASGNPPYWAYQWAGGTALARHLLDKPQIVAGRSILDLGCGNGIVGIAAAKAGARDVVAVDVEPAAMAATALNAAANAVQVETRLGDILDEAPPASDLVLVGDLFYAPETAQRVVSFLTRCRTAGLDVLVGDPYRAHLPRDRLRLLAEHMVPDFGGPGPLAAGVFAFI